MAKKEEIKIKRNSIKIEDCSSKAIQAVLPLLQDIKWDRKEISESIISYTWDSIAKEYVKLYASIIKN